MAVVIKGASRGGAAQMGRYATAQGKNEFAQVQEVRGTLATDARGAIAEMAAVAKGSQCKDFLYHAQINPQKGEQLTADQWKKAVDTLEKNLKLDGHQRVVFSHTKDGREHYHVVWNRVDPETLKAVNMGNNYRAHERAAVQIEKEFGLQPLERRPNLEGGRGRTPDPDRPAPAARAPESWEYKQAERIEGQNPRQIKAEVSLLRAQSETGREFVANLEAHGFAVAKGDRRDFVLIDREGGEHSLGRYSGMKAGELREFMADVDREHLPTVAQAKPEQQAERGETRKEKEQREGWRAEAEAPPAPKFSPGQDKGAVNPLRGMAGKLADAAADVLMSAVDTLLGGILAGEQKKISPEEYLHNKKARQEYNQQRAEEARREEKREAALDDLRGEGRLDAGMLRTFNRHDLEEIKAHGINEGVQRILEEQERQRGERERERYRER